MVGSQRKATDDYHPYGEDVALLKWVGLDAYTLSISWSKILPEGKKSGKINREGVDYYGNLIDELEKNGITPFVTLSHSNVPKALEDEYGGFRSPQIIEDFGDYADVCFFKLGDKVKKWITINEPWSFSEGVVSDETISVTHHQLLAHARAVQLYRTKYKDNQKGEIGIAINSIWVSNSEEDPDFTLNWFLDPITIGKYPDGVHTFSENNIENVKDSVDFLGINYYIRPGVDCPQGLKDLLLNVNNKYKGPIYITDNGFDEKNDGNHEAQHDDKRVAYHRKHLSQIRQVTQDNKVDVKGYFAWSVWEFFEWASDFNIRFENTNVEFKNELKVTPKFSAHWFKNILQRQKEAPTDIPIQPAQESENEEGQPNPISGLINITLLQLLLGV